MLDVSTQAKIAEYPEYITLDTQKLHAFLASKFTMAKVGLFSTYSAKGLHMTHWKLTWKKKMDHTLIIVWPWPNTITSKTHEPLWTSTTGPIYTTLQKQKLMWACSKLYFSHISIATTTMPRNSLTLKVTYRAPSRAQLEWKHFHIWRNGLPSQSNQWIRPSEVNIMVPPPQTSTQGYTQSYTKYELSPWYYASVSFSRQYSCTAMA